MRGPRDFPRGSGYISQYIPTHRHSHLPNNGSTAAVAYAAVTAVAANVDAGVPVEWDASVEEV